MNPRRSRITEARPIAAWRRRVGLAAIMAGLVSTTACSLALGSGKGQSGSNQNTSSVPRHRPPPSTKNEVVIDALTGEITGDRRISRDRETRIIVLNTNPFLYRYRAKVTATPVLETAQVDFFVQSLGIKLPDPTTTTAVLLAAPADPDKGSEQKFDSTVTTGASCPRRIVADIRARQDRLLALKNTIDSGFKRGAEALANQEAAMADAWKPSYDRRSTGEQVLSSAEATYPRAAVFVRLADSAIKSQRDSVNEFASLVKVFVERTDPLVASYPDCPKFVEVRKLGSDFSIDSGVYRGNMATFAEAKKKAASIEEQFKNVATEEKTVYWSVDVGPFEDAQDVDVVVDRRTVGTDTTYRPVTNTKLQFGGSRRLAIGAGFSVASLAVNSFGPVTSLATPSDARPGDTLQTRVGVTGRSSRRITPMLVLSTRLLTNHWKGADYISALHAALGATVRSEGDKTNVEYFIGPGISTLNNYLFFSTGWYVGRVTELAGVKENDRLPSPTATIPVVTRTHTKFPAFMVSFRLR